MLFCFLNYFFIQFGLFEKVIVQGKYKSNSEKDIQITYTFVNSLRYNLLKLESFSKNERTVIMILKYKIAQKFINNVNYLPCFSFSHFNIFISCSILSIFNPLENNALVNTPQEEFWCFDDHSILHLEKSTHF